MPNFIEDDNLFMKYVSAKKTGNIKEAKKISNIIDNNAKIAENYTNTIKVYCEYNKNDKINFSEYLKTMKIKEVKLEVKK
jgi:hypothetical protein